MNQALDTLTHASIAFYVMVIVVVALITTALAGR